MLTWDEAALLEDQGVEIEAHTVSHPLLVYEDTRTIKNELAGAKATLEKKLKKRVRAFAYPNGCWDQRVRELVREAGYDCAFTTASGWHCRGEDPFAIRRIMLHEENLTGLDGRFSPAVLALRLTGWV
jgi:peptidoglycan/xylan/chitin deacetylase (PgdA/CDA1 family)